MKLGVLTVPLYSMSTAEAFEYLARLGVQTVELGAGGYPGDTHLKTAELLADKSKLKELQALLSNNKLEVSALSVHGNPVHPQKEIAEKAHREFIDACRAAQALGVDTVITFSGCPGDGPESRFPNWVTCSWPSEYTEILKYQWDECLIPYWQRAAAEAKEYGVTKIALEAHPGFCVYNTSSLLRLREAVGPSIGMNFDPSHLFWQGIDPVESITALKGAIHHFHAKDTALYPHNIAVNGVLDTGSYADMLGRSWLFRTVGYGHDSAVWKAIISTLRAVGYDGAVSIEHEDAMMSVREGLERAVSFLQDIVFTESPAEMWWA